MEYHLIWYDWGDSYTNESKIENRDLVDYYENNIKQSDEVKNAMFAEMARRASHNVWTVVSFEGTRQTKAFCESMEKALQNKQDFEIHLGFIRLKTEDK